MPRFGALLRIPKNEIEFGANRNITNFNLYYTIKRLREVKIKQGY